MEIFLFSIMGMYGAEWGYMGMGRRGEKLSSFSVEEGDDVEEEGEEDELGIAVAFDVGGGFLDAAYYLFYIAVVDEGREALREGFLFSRHGGKIGNADVVDEVLARHLGHVAQEPA